MAGALEGIRVLDFTHALNGPFCTMLLGHLGAEIIKIEPKGGDNFRRSWMPANAPHDGYEFLMINTNKKSVTLDLTGPRGKEICRRLIAISDVLVENYSLETARRLGLGEEAVRPVNPRLIYACSRGFGESGPYAPYGCNASVNNAMTGWTHTSWQLSGSPGTKAQGIGDQAGGVSLAVGILAALYARDRLGKGQKIEVSMQEALLGFMVSSLHTHFTGNKVGEDAARVADGYYSLRIPDLNDAAWEKLAELMGRQELKSDTRFATPSLRRKNKAALEQVVKDWAQHKTRKELWESLKDTEYFGGPVLSIGEVLEDPHIRSRQAFINMQHPKAGSITLLAPWIRMSLTPTEIKTVSPLIGQHTNEVLGNLLGFSQAELAELSHEGVI